jgi:hypothetical protein
MAIKEFSLAELLDDPMVGLIMQRDGVERRSPERLLDTIGGIDDDASGNRTDHDPR